MNIKLSNADIDYILREVYITDCADPFGELEYLFEFVEARIMDALPRKIKPTDEELREAVVKLLEIEALTTAYRSLEFETMTGLRRNTEDVMERLIYERRMEFTGEEMRLGFR